MGLTLNHIVLTQLQCFCVNLNKDVRYYKYLQYNYLDDSQSKSSFVRSLEAVNLSHGKCVIKPNIHTPQPYLQPVVKTTGPIDRTHNEIDFSQATS